MDNWFTSVPLAEELLKPPYKLTVVGTLRSNKREIPKEIANTRSRPVGTLVFGFDKELTLVSYKPKPNKVVYLLSSTHDQPAINTDTKKIRNYRILQFYKRMSRMAKHYQGVRAGLIFKILRGKENTDSENTNQKSSVTTSCATNHVVFEKELEKRTEPRQVREKRWIIGRSSSLSNMPKINSAAQRRCSSVPPTITVQYLLPSTTHNERAHSYNLLSDGPDSYDGDFSGTDSDVTYCPTDVEILSDSSSPDILEEPSTSGIMSGVFHGNIDEGRKRKSRSDPSQWKKNKNKKLRMSGKEYLGFTKPKSES
ncbi:unnamed protein product [Arctia plantaginis]|uniref:PiggyBac transposable element-derived protein domain-containing protein n=1 Tax=Arctia plantaginis TaxID=874455 RepID=A0A8S1AJS1_ARCPL|nr:unnamed protein product [Arctia plantaginis]